jgi:hypothetical protein
MRIFFKRGLLQKNFDIILSCQKNYCLGLKGLVVVVKKTIVEIMPITMSIARRYKLLSQLNINKIVHEGFC